MPLEESSTKIPIYTYPRPQIRIVREDKLPSEEMLKWLLNRDKK